MDQSLVHTFSLGKFVWTNGPESSSKVSPTLVLVHGWLFPLSLVWFAGATSDNVGSRKACVK